MLVSSKRFLTGMALASTLCATGWSQDAQPAQPAAQGQAAQGQAAQGQAAQGQAAAGQAAAEKPKAVKDQGEHDIFTQVTQEKDPTKRIALLDTWKQKYSETDFKKERLQYYLQSYQALNQADKMLGITKEMLALDPADFTAMYWIATLVPNQPNALTNTEYVGMAEKAAQGMLANVDKTFAPANKQATVTDEQWKKARTDSEALAHKTLGWTAMAKKDFAAVREHFGKALQANPGAGEVSWWLGSTIISQKDPATIPEGLFHVARAAAYDGPGALSPEGRKQINDYLVKAYNTFHGADAPGLEQLKSQAKASAMAPAGFTIKSKVDLQNEQLKAQQEKDAADPVGAAWRTLRDNLKTPEGAKMAEGMIGAQITMAMRGTVVSATPKSLVLAMSDKTTPEVTLTPEEGTFPKVEPGTELNFENPVGKAFTQEPFMLTLTVDKASVKGLPASAPSKKPAAGAKKPRRGR